ncbi:hypothetical protein Ndes2526A_g02143 [Nannochloris sp. 'desiccata']
MCPHNNAGPDDARTGGEHSSEPSAKRIKINDVGINSEKVQDDAERKFQKKIRSAKRAARRELSVTKGEWQKHSYATSNLLSTKTLRDSLPRIDARNISLEDFIDRFEKPGLPVVLTHACDDWPASQGAWTEENLLKNYGDHKFKVGSDDDGYAVRLKLKHFLKYAKHAQHGAADDSPLYIFDGTFADRDTSKALKRDYRPPELFEEDLMAFAGERRRPPYRWFVMGPARSGTSVHIDPLATSAWNTLLTGHKRWALFPPGIPKAVVKPPGLEREASTWFTKIWPKTQEETWPGPSPIDVIQVLGRQSLFQVAGSTV